LNCSLRSCRAAWVRLDAVSHGSVRVVSVRACTQCSLLVACFVQLIASRVSALWFCTRRAASSFFISLPRQDCGFQLRFLAFWFIWLATSLFSRAKAERRKTLLCWFVVRAIILLGHSGLLVAGEEPPLFLGQPIPQRFWNPRWHPQASKVSHTLCLKSACSLHPNGPKR